MHRNGELILLAGAVDAVQHLELTGVCQYIRWLPLIFLLIEADNMMLGYFHHWPIVAGQVI